VTRIPLKPSTRIYAVLARNAPIAVVFRRGPSKQVLTIGWNIETHEFRLGQWFKGRIYERRCDLSPSGEKLIYFAAKYRSPLYTWTAVSRPPFLTALALWPKGDAWGGGGLFKNERVVSLNHPKNQMALAEGFKLPKSMSLEPCGVHSGCGEDGPILCQRLLRDGWKLQQAAEGWENKPASRIWHEFSKQEVWAKSYGSLTLEMLISGIHERDGSWYVLEHRVTDPTGHVAIDLGRSDWADWSRAGELLFARDGRLYRVVVDRQSDLRAPEELIDLRDLKFESRSSPPEATVWKGRSPRGQVLIGPSR
jgi:hypothetical protein